MMTLSSTLKPYGLAICAAGLLVSNTTDAFADKTLVFGTYAFEKPTVTVQKLRPILNALEVEMTKRSGEKITIKLNVAKDYRTAIRDVVRGRIDFGRFGQAAYVIARSADRNLKIIAVEGDHAQKTFRSLVIVNTSSPINHISDLNGASFAFGNEYSTTGRYLPQAYLAKHGITAQRLKRFEYLDRHDQVASAVSDGRYDAGAISEWVFKDMVAKGARIRSIASFSSVTKPWVGRSELPLSTQNLIRDSLIALQGIPVLGNIKKDCFLPGSDRDYRRARLSISENWMFFRKQTVDASIARLTE